MEATEGAIMINDTTAKVWKVAAGIGVSAVLVIGAVALTSSGDLAAADTQAEVAATVTTASATPIVATTGAISEAEAADILFMREEEKLARDVYLTLGELWDTPIFANIADAEQTHMDAVYGLIVSYELTDPVGENPIGVFEDPGLQSMYDDLIAQGSTSQADALEVGALIEEVDIEDLIDAMAITTMADIDTVWEQLLAGSQNHLRAFTSRLDALGVDYTPSILDTDTYDGILASSTSRGRISGAVRGWSS